MLDRLLSGALNLLVMSMITLIAAAALVCAHGGLLQICAGASKSGAGMLTAAASLSVAAGFLIRNRNDLADR
jgi:hypothetical protein